MKYGIKETSLKILDELQGIESLRMLQEFMPQLERLRARLADDEFRIAVVGEFSSGKSTFINALLGRDILQHATNETTAALTRIVNVAEDDPLAQTGKVFLRSGDCVELVNLDGLKEYTTTASERYQVAEEIEAVEIYLPVLESAHKIVVVDTPGLNGVADGHREQTVSLIQQAHACIYLLQRRGLADSDIQFLTYLTRFQKNFIFVQNFIDDFRRIEGETVEGKLAEQREILELKVFKQTEGAEYRICGVSALMELASRDVNIPRLYSDSQDDLTPEERKRLGQQSHFDAFLALMQENFSAERLAEIQYGDTTRAICEWLVSLEKYTKRQQEQANEVYEASRERHAIERLEQLKEKVLTNRPRQETYLNNFIAAKGVEIFSEERLALEQSVEKLQQELAENIGTFKELEALQIYERALPAALRVQVSELWDNSSHRCQIQIDNFFQLLLARIEEYSGIKSENLTFDGWSPAASGVQQNTIQLENREQQLEAEGEKIRQMKADQAQLAQKAAQQSAELRKAEAERTAAMRKKEEAEAVYRRSIDQLRSRPRATKHEEAYTDYVYRGGFGILDALLGPKEVTRYKTVEDDSAGQAWDRKKAEIENKYARDRSELEKQIAVAKRREANLLNAREIFRDRLASVRCDIQKEEQKLAEEKALLEKMMKIAREEYLAAYKDSMKKQLASYLMEGDHCIRAEMTDRLRETIDAAKEELARWAVARFNEAVEQKLAWIQAAQEERRPEIKQRAEDLEQAGNTLIKMRKELEECLS